MIQLVIGVLLLVALIYVVTQYLTAAREESSELRQTEDEINEKLEKLEVEKRRGDSLRIEEELIAASQQNRALEERLKKQRKSQENN